MKKGTLHGSQQAVILKITSKYFRTFPTEPVCHIQWNFNVRLIHRCSFSVQFDVYKDNPLPVLGRFSQTFMLSYSLMFMFKFIYLSEALFCPGYHYSSLDCPCVFASVSPPCPPRHVLFVLSSVRVSAPLFPPYIFIVCVFLVGSSC